MAAPRRILVRCPNPVGDAVMATPALRALRRAHPSAEIVLMGLPSNEMLLRGVDSVAGGFVGRRRRGLGRRLLD